MSLCSTFAKAYEYKCEYINKDGIKCNGMPMLGEIIQVCMTLIFILLGIMVISIWFNLNFVI